MNKKEFNILDFISKEEILLKLKDIGSRKLTETGHDFDIFGSILISEAAQKSTNTYTDKAREKPALALIEVVLSANRNYNKAVKPKLKAIETEYPGLKTFDQLNEIIKSKSRDDFYCFWGHHDEKKYNTLKNILIKITSIRESYKNASDDFDLMNLWGSHANLFNYKKDIIGSIPNIAIATFQHLRMIFGVNTIKPDQRVKEVLDYEFGLYKLSDKNAIKAVEQIASFAGLKALTIDQIFVQYGSSYYNKTSNKLSIKQVAKNLKDLGVNNKIISIATLLTERQVEQIK